MNINDVVDALTVWSYLMAFVDLMILVSALRYWFNPTIIAYGGTKIHDDDPLSIGAQLILMGTGSSSQTVRECRHLLTHLQGCINVYEFTTPLILGHVSIFRVNYQGTSLLFTLVASTYYGEDGR